MIGVFFVESQPVPRSRAVRSVPTVDREPAAPIGAGPGFGWQSSESEDVARCLAGVPAAHRH